MDSVFSPAEETENQDLSLTFLLHLDISQTSVFNHGEIRSYKLCFTFITVLQLYFSFPTPQTSSVHSG